MRYFFRAIGIFLGAGLAGCQISAPAPGRYQVEAPRTAFYKGGPAQPTGPDVSLSRGDQLVLLASAQGFSRVRLADGREGYVASRDLRPLPSPARPPAKRPARKSSPAHPAESTLPPDNDLFPSATPADPPPPRFRF